MSEGSDKTVLAPVEVPGMQITFQSPIGPTGKGVNFIFGIDVLTPEERGNELLDKVARWARRQDAFEQLLLDQHSLAANRKLLAKTRAARTAAQSGLDAKVVAIKGGGGRPREVDPTRVAPQDVNAVMQHDQRIVEIEGQIAGCEERIPRWRAIIAGQDDIDLDQPAAMAAE